MRQKNIYVYIFCLDAYTITSQSSEAFWNDKFNIREGERERERERKNRAIEKVRKKTQKTHIHGNTLSSCAAKSTINTLLLEITLFSFSKCLDDKLLFSFLILLSKLNP